MDYSILSLFVSDSSSSPKLLKNKIDDFMFTILMISYQVLNINCPKICILFALRTKYMYVHFYMQKHIVKLVLIILSQTFCILETEISEGLKVFCISVWELSALVDISLVYQKINLGLLSQHKFVGGDFHNNNPPSPSKKKKTPQKYFFIDIRDVHFVYMYSVYVPGDMIKKGYFTFLFCLQKSLDL